ncbi:DNA topoisomerase IV subunit A [Dellaglioa algida]|nr:DNA topoisomerase IV subunit A [Dellaglioa algida]MDK1716540.1 DNA topoisomerase IV subunit A [Dellaglioa algida]MDK1719967.1 DNA topoisomerase IV subunit A [Dellaglioa algida]MDK1721482.1 DNA topoisomerase IV subunit A [Dellaglioa algida]MDK1723296.1 DNA topoisomerase IV subunit A [Dellaglioa algida]MDK1724930.1 DNA topoisomerase IV subunit A [Dellaglioa algida]
MEQDTSKIQELTLEDVMGERFGRYSKYIIQERALPDIRDGLKPVQRRILYAMNQDGNTYDKGFRKSAKSVGNVMGNFHPHGDSSIYEAMVRMSQNWKLRTPLIEMHGNNGSMDGDSPAAMRYTEARTSKIATEMLRDIEKETVDFVLNFDDTEYEPTVLPARFPNLLVNGATGISAGYATEIPPHNLSEVVDAVVYLIGHPNATLDKLMSFVKGPDFPTGGILQGLSGIQSAYKTGRGKVVVRSRTEIQELKGGKTQIIISEIPYEVNKAVLVKKMDEIRLLKKVDGIAEVRDESDREGLQIAIELKRNVNAQGILNYLFKNTDLQISYNFNMVAINNQRPELVGLKKFLSSYLEYQLSVTKKRTEFDLKKAESRQHIVEGLIKALSILDRVIKAIRASKDKKSAKVSLMELFDFTEKQAEAIVSLQLYRLSNTDVTALEKENAELAEKITGYKAILADPKMLSDVVKKELKQVSKEYATPRMTEIQEHIEDIKIETAVLITPEDVQVLVSHDGYLKRSSLRSFNASGVDENGLKDEDRIVFNESVNTLDHLFMFTNKGNMIYRPIHEITEAKWKDTGEHISQTIGLDTDEYLIKAFTFKKVDAPGKFIFATKNGFIKQTAVSDLQPGRTYKGHASKFMKLKSADDDVILISYLKEDDNSLFIFSASHDGYGLRYPLEEVPVVGAKAAGVIAMNLKQDDFVASTCLVSENSQIGLLTQRGSFKCMSVSEVSSTSRAKRGVLILRELKKEPHKVIGVRPITKEVNLSVITESGNEFIVEPMSYPLSDRYSNGSFIIDTAQLGMPILLSEIK